MPIGAITPGNFITVTADVITGLPASYTFTPSPTMAILSANMQSLTLQMATNDKYLETRIATEETARAAAVAAEASARATAVSNEATARAAADYTYYRYLTTLPVYTGSPAETLTGSGAGAWQTSAVVKTSTSTAAAVNDVIEVLCMFNLTSVTSSVCKAKLLLTQDTGGTPTAVDLSGSEMNLYGLGSPLRIAIAGFYSITDAGAWKVELQFYGAAGDSLVVQGDGFIRSVRTHFGP